MEIFILLAALVIVVIIAKFIYDSYLTGNTEQNWEEFKKTDPATAKKVESSVIGVKPIKQDLDLKKNLLKEKNKLVLAKMKYEFNNYIDEHLEKIADDYPELEDESRGIFNLTYLYEALTNIQIEFQEHLEKIEISKNDFLFMLKSIAEERIDSINKAFPSYTFWDDKERPDIINRINSLFKDSSSNKEVSKADAKAKLGSRNLVNQGINENIKIDEITETVIFSEPDLISGKPLESKGWIIYFHAVNRYYRKKALEYFHAGNYREALSQRLFIVVDDNEVQKYLNRSEVDILVSLKEFESGDNDKDFVIDKVYFD